jgi:hypothetical protein
MGKAAILPVTGGGHLERSLVRKIHACIEEAAHGSASKPHIPYESVHAVVCPAKIGGKWAARLRPPPDPGREEAPGRSGIGFTAAEPRHDALEGDRAHVAERLGDGVVGLCDGLGEVEEGSGAEESAGCQSERTRGDILAVMFGAATVV